MSDQCFPKPKMASANILFQPQTKLIEITVIEESGNRESPHNSNILFDYEKLDISLIVAK